MIIREIKMEDAENLLNLIKEVESTAAFMLMEPSERETSLEQQQKQIELIDQRGTYCWYECADYPSIPEIVEEVEPTVVPGNSKFNISFHYTPRPSNISIARMKQGEERLYNQSLVKPSEQGVFFYEIDARWNFDNLEADSFYAFVIEVK
jgi:hypothetical protein